MEAGGSVFAAFEIERCEVLERHRALRVERQNPHEGSPRLVGAAAPRVSDAETVQRVEIGLIRPGDWLEQLNRVGRVAAFGEIRAELCGELAVSHARAQRLLQGRDRGAGVAAFPCDEGEMAV